jgi:SulP family sulfate permease
MLLGLTKRFHHYLILPGTLLAATGGFYGVIWASQIPLTTVRAQGWLLGPFPAGNLWQPLTWSGLSQVQWGVIAQHSSTLGLLVFVSLLSLVLTNGGIELALDRELDLNRELQAVGLANLVAGLGSTMAGNQALPSTLLVHKMGAAHRLTGVFKTLPCFTVLLLGPAFLAYFPKPILGSLLLFLGLDLLWQWLYRAWFRLCWADYLTILTTLVVINQAGFMPGIAVGMGMTALQFLYQCSQANPVSPVSIELAAEPAADRTGLTHPPTGVEWVDLQGFLFFGNAAALFRQLRDRILHPPTGAPPQYLVLNFQAVAGLDASAVLSFSKLLKLAGDHGLTLVFSQVSVPFQRQLCRGGGLALDSETCVVFDRRDQSLSWCQEQIQPAQSENGLPAAMGTPPSEAANDPAAVPSG